MPQSKLKVTLHIGGAKCGSSAIQAYLGQNHKALRDRGVLVPGVKLDMHSAVSGEQIWAFEDAVSSNCLGALGTRLSRLVAKAEEANNSAIVLSAENICNHPSLVKIVCDTLNDVDLRVLFYVRRQDDFLISSWQQWHLKRYATIEAYLADRVGKLGCWLTAIEPWADTLGDEAVTVRPFLRDRLKNGDVVDDFCLLAGIDQTDLKPLARNANPSFDEALGRLAHRARDVFADQHDNRFYEVMVRLLGESALKKHSASGLLDLDTRRRIYKRYATENEALKQRFLPDWGNEPLFLPPSRGDVLQQSSEADLQQEMAMLTRAVFALAEKCEAA